MCEIGADKIIYGGKKMNYKEYVEKREKENKITIKKASELMGKSQSFVRIAMQRNLINIGVCLKKEGSKRYDYYINPKLFYEYLGENKKNIF